MGKRGFLTFSPYFSGGMKIRFPFERLTTLWSYNWSGTNDRVPRPSRKPSRKSQCAPPTASSGPDSRVRGADYIEAILVSGEVLQKLLDLAKDFFRKIVEYLLNRFYARCKKNEWRYVK